MKKLMITTLSGLLLACFTTYADEKYDHFPALESTNTNAALCNLAQFNKKLHAITSKPKLTAEDMVKVHELTYTLENAVIRLQKDLETIAIDLEKVHKASEHLESKVIKASGKKYLEATGLLIEPESC